MKGRETASRQVKRADHSGPPALSAAAHVVAIDRASDEGAAARTENRSKRLGISGRDDVAEHAACDAADDQTCGAVAVFAVIAVVISAVDAIVVAEAAFSVASLVAAIVKRRVISLLVSAVAVLFIATHLIATCLFAAFVLHALEPFTLESFLRQPFALPPLAIDADLPPMAIIAIMIVIFCQGEPRWYGHRTGNHHGEHPPSNPVHVTNPLWSS